MRDFCHCQLTTENRKPVADHRLFIKIDLSLEVCGGLAYFPRAFGELTRQLRQAVGAEEHENQKKNNRKFGRAGHGLILEHRTSNVEH